MFGVFGLKIEKLTALSGDKHVKLLLSKNESRLEAIAFRVSVGAVPFRVGDEIDIAVTIDSNEYNGRQSLSLFIKDWRISGTDSQKLFADIDMYEDYKRKEKINYNCPSREEVGVIYRAIKENVSEETLRQSHFNTLGLFKTMVSLDVLKELNLVEEYCDNSLTKLRAVPGKKAELSQSKILEFLRGEKDGISI